MLIVPGQAGKDLCDPHLGMTDGQFTGSAVVFPTTVTFGASRRTANLQ